MRKQAAARRLGREWQALAAAQAQAMQAFETMARRSLAPVLGSAGLRRIQRDAAITTTMRRGVIVHAPLRHRGKLTLARIRRERPLVGVLATMVPLLDPVSLATLNPGFYAIGLRWIGGDGMAFDFFADKGRPVISTQAIAKEAANEPNIWGFDIDITLPDDDSFFPPPNGEFCISILHWKKCWRWDWPTIDW